jgi:hypothetical protein
MLLLSAANRDMYLTCEEKGGGLRENIIFHVYVSLFPPMLNSVFTATIKIFTISYIDFDLSVEQYNGHYEGGRQERRGVKFRNTIYSYFCMDENERRVERTRIYNSYPVRSSPLPLPLSY